MKSTKVKITERAAVARINRALQPRGELLRRTRSERLRANLGDWHVVDPHAGTVVRTHASIGGLAEELNVLKPWEAIEA